MHVIQVFKEKYIPDFNVNFRIGERNYLLFLEHKSEINSALILKSAVEELLSGSLSEKFIAYNMLQFVDEVPQELLDPYITSSLGLSKNFMQLNSLYNSLVRLIGFNDLTFHYLDLIENSSNDFMRYLYLENLLQIVSDDMLSFNSGYIKVDAKATYTWTENHFKKEYLKKSDFNHPEYEKETNEAYVKRYGAVMNIYKNSEHRIPILQTSRLLFPHKGDCPPSLKKLYSELLDK